MERTISPTKAEMARAVAILRRGGLVAFPTETVYGLAANALDANAVRRIFEVKGRPSTSPLIVHVDSVEMAQNRVVSSWPEAAEILARAFWPGPLSLVLPKGPQIPNEVTAGLATVGVRSPAHPVAQELIQAVNLPLAAPSANPFTHVSPTEAQHVRDAFGDRVECILDGGSTSVGIESTVVSLVGPRPVVLRPGMISVGELEKHVGSVDLGGSPSVSGAHSSPGQHEKHYSPATRLLITARPPAGRGAYIWWSAEVRGIERSVRIPSDPPGYARELYSILHALDKEALDFIAVEPVPDTAEWAAIRDRLQRAAERQ